MDGDRYLTTKELAALLRVKERKIYELAASGEAPCVKAMGKLLFPREEIEAWLAERRSGPPPAATRRPMVALGSHDPLFDWALRESRAGFATLFDGSGDGLARFAAGQGAVAGLHLYEPASAQWNVGAVTASGVADAALLGFALRRRGLVWAEGAAGATMADLDGRRLARRQPEAGAERLLEHLLAEAGAAPETALVARSEADAVAAVAAGKAEACFGLVALAAERGLRVTALVEERFDLLVDRRSFFEPAFQRFWRFCAGDAFRARAAEIEGYAVDALGAVRWNAG